MIEKISLRKFLFFLLNRQRVCVFFLRGGLGNQLFQVINLIEISKQKNFVVIFCDQDVRKNPRDKDGAAVFLLNFRDLICNSPRVYRASYILETILQIFRRNKIKLLSLHNVDFDNTDSPADKILFTGNGYLQDPRNIFKLHKKSLPSNLLTHNVLSSRAEIALHIRATDSLHNVEMRLEDSFYNEALNILAAEENVRIDVFSDDLDYAKKLCERLGKYRFNFVEDNRSLVAIEILACLSNYNSLVSSKSTLCWWACHYATLMNEDVTIISPWQAPFHHLSWIAGK